MKKKKNVLEISFNLSTTSADAHLMHIYIEKQLEKQHSGMQKPLKGPFTQNVFLWLKEMQDVGL